MTLASLEGEFLVIEGLHVKLRERIGSTTKRSVHGSINLIEGGGYGFSLLRHRSGIGRRERSVNLVMEWMKRSNVMLFVCFKRKEEKGGGDIQHNMLSFLGHVIIIYSFIHSRA